MVVVSCPQGRGDNALYDARRSSRLRVSRALPVSTMEPDVIHLYQRGSPRRGHCPTATIEWMIRDPLFILTRRSTGKAEGCAHNDAGLPVVRGDEDSAYVDTTTNVYMVLNGRLVGHGQQLHRVAPLAVGPRHSCRRQSPRTPIRSFLENREKHV